MSGSASRISSSSSAEAEAEAEAEAVELEASKIDPSPNWSHLPSDLLSTVFSLLPSNTDCIHFRSVCPSWRSASPRRLPLPLQMFPPPARIDEDGHHFCSYFDLVSSHTGTVDIPELRFRQFCGSTDGWLVLRGTGSRPPFPISVFNPFTRSLLPLPSLKHSVPPEKIVITSFDPDPSAAVAVIGCDFPLYYHSRGQKDWRPLQGSSSFHDVICFNGDLYAVGVDDFRKIFFYSPTGPDTIPVEIPLLEDHPVQRGKHGDEKNYLVESSGDLFLVIRSFSFSGKTEWLDMLETGYFEVFKLDLSERTKRGAREVWNLEDGVFFLGVNTSFSISAANFSRAMAVNRHIYFTHDGFNRRGEMVNWEDNSGSFDLENFLWYPLRRLPKMRNVVIPPDIFFVPKLE